MQLGPLYTMPEEFKLKTQQSDHYFGFGFV